MPVYDLKPVYQRMVVRFVRRPVDPCGPAVVCVVFVLFISAVLVTHYRLTNVYLSQLQGKAKGDNDVFTYSRSSPLIFIGGFPRSGATLMRAMLDAHPDIRCGQVSRIVPPLLNVMREMSHPVEVNRLNEAGVTQELLDSVVSKFILNVIVSQGEGGARLCTKDPMLIRHTKYLARLFPQAKFLFMVRDGRAAIHSAITRNVTMNTFDPSDPGGCLRKWNKVVDEMHRQCQKVGEDKCMAVYYEQVVLHPHQWMRQVLSFLELPWDERVLHHERHINEPGGVWLSRTEISSSQIVRPVNTLSLGQWVGFYSSDVVRDMSDIAPMLATLGYDPDANPTYYDLPDESVLENNRVIQDQAERGRKKHFHVQLKDLQTP